MKESEYYESLNARLHDLGTVRVPRKIISSDIKFEEGYIYEMELVPKLDLYGNLEHSEFIDITAHKKMDMIPDNVVNINR